jgi:hypothetical protein
MSVFNINSSSVQGDEDLPRPLSLDENQDIQLAYDATVLTEGQELINSKLQIEDLSLEKTIGCEDGSRTETQASLDSIANSVPKNKALSSKETKVDKNIQFGSTLWRLNLIPFSGISAADKPKQRSFAYPASFLDMKVWKTIREYIFPSTNESDAQDQICRCYIKIIR